MIPPLESGLLPMTEADIERFLRSTKGPASFFVLSLLYPQLRYNDVTFHQDHIHPAAYFTEHKFAEMGIPKEQWREWLDCRDCVPNLQLMNGHENVVKNATPLKDWLETKTDYEKATFVSDNYFPEQTGLGFNDFMTFFKARKEILRAKLGKVLALMNDRPVPIRTEWNDHNEEIDQQETP
jgi:hypothetical protein